MIRLAIVVEGQTEEDFVKATLVPHLRKKGVFAQAILIGRARNIGSGGGDVTLERLLKDMTHLCNNFNHVTSLVDYYGFRGKQDLTVEDLEMQLAQGVSDRVHHWISGKVIPYVQKYEFEGLLFSNVSVFAELPDVPMGIAQQLQLIR